MASYRAYFRDDNGGPIKSREDFDADIDTEVLATAETVLERTFRALVGRAA
jgi:hypothetical protein